MYQITQGTTHQLPDVEAFIETLNGLDQHAMPQVRELFEPQVELVVTRAPGRLDVMGGIADYSGALVLQLPTHEATLVALQRDDTRTLRIVSLRAGSEKQVTSFTIPLAELERDGEPVDYASAQAYFYRDLDNHWASYVAGAFLVLMRECEVAFPEGVRILIQSEVPEGVAVASSAALEVAVMQAVAAAFDVSLEPREMALLCQLVENMVAGAPCGVMDQVTAVLGETNQLLSLLCQPAEVQGMLPIPDEITFWGIDSGERHAITEADYSAVRVSAFMGYRIIADIAELPVKPGAPGAPLVVVDPVWDGYLANIRPSEFEQFYAPHLPQQIAGHTFRNRYEDITDSVTRVQSKRHYAVRVATAHPIYEHFRARLYVELLENLPNERSLTLMGELMYQSHVSYSNCGLGSVGTDRLVELVRGAGRAEGLYGAKITGGGGGGTVVVLAQRDTEEAIRSVARTYARENGHIPHIFKGSSPGAAPFGVLRLKPTTS